MQARIRALCYRDRKDKSKCKPGIEFNYFHCSILIGRTRAFHHLLLLQIKADASQLRDSDFSEAAKEIEEVVKTKWHALSRHSDDRNRLINRACKFYLTAEEVSRFNNK